MHALHGLTLQFSFPYLQFQTQTQKFSVTLRQANCPTQTNTIKQSGKCVFGLVCGKSFIGRKQRVECRAPARSISNQHLAKELTLSSPYFNWLLSLLRFSLTVISCQAVLAYARHLVTQITIRFQIMPKLPRFCLKILFKSEFNSHYNFI